MLRSVREKSMRPKYDAQGRRRVSSKALHPLSDQSYTRPGGVPIGRATARCVPLWRELQLAAIVTMPLTPGASDPACSQTVAKAGHRCAVSARGNQAEGDEWNACGPRRASQQARCMASTGGGRDAGSDAHVSPTAAPCRSGVGHVGSLMRQAPAKLKRMRKGER